MKVVPGKNHGSAAECKSLIIYNYANIFNYFYKIKSFTDENTYIYIYISNIHIYGHNQMRIR